MVWRSFKNIFHHGVIRRRSIGAMAGQAEGTEFFFAGSASGSESLRIGEETRPPRLTPRDAGRATIQQKTAALRVCNKLDLVTM